MSVLVELFALAPVAPADLAPHRLDLAARLEGAPSLNLDRSWQAVERALAACDPVFRDVFESGTAVDAEIRYLPPESVARLSDALSALDPALLAARVADLVAAPGELYGGPWTPAEAPLLLSTIERLAAFWRTAAARGRAISVVWG